MTVFHRGHIYRQERERVNHFMITVLMSTSIIKLILFVTECLTECSEEIKSKLPRFQAHLVEEITTQCSVHLKQVNDIPRLYRRTNKEVLYQY